MLETLSTDIIEYSIGPYHPDLPGPMRITLGLDGELIVSAKTESGFSHRGVERLMQEHFWQSSIAYADHIDPLSSIFYELALCLAGEEIGKITVPKRAQQIRIILSEINRIYSHLTSMVEIAKAVEAPTMAHYVLRDREKFLDLMELLTGSRFSHNFLRFGGVASDISEGFIERVIEVCDLIRVRPKEYNDLFTFNQGFIRRTINQAVLGAKLVEKYGITGPAARAARVNIDVRRSPGYSGYSELNFEPAHGKGEAGVLGDAYDRFIVRLREITQSADIIKQVVEGLKEGPFLQSHLETNFKLPAGEAYVRVESARGVIGCYLVSDGSSSPFRVQFRTPSAALFQAIPDVLIGASLEDLSVYLSSLDISVSEVER